jgi:hypothetical protein
VKFLAITLIVHAPDPMTGVQKFQSDIAPVPRREIPDPRWPSPAPDPLLTGSPA